LDNDFPKLRAVYDRVGALSSIEAWIEAHKDDYPTFKGRRSA
jgi:hypothetical protein